MPPDERDEAIAELQRLGRILDDALRDFGHSFHNETRKAWIVVRVDPRAMTETIVGLPQETYSAAHMLAVRTTATTGIPAAQLRVVMMAW